MGMLIVLTDTVGLFDTKLLSSTALYILNKHNGYYNTLQYAHKQAKAYRHLRVHKYILWAYYCCLDLRVWCCNMTGCREIHSISTPNGLFFFRSGT